MEAMQIWNHKIKLIFPKCFKPQNICVKMILHSLPVKSSSPTKCYQVWECLPLLPELYSRFFSFWINNWMKRANSTDTVYSRKQKWRVWEKLTLSREHEPSKYFRKTVRAKIQVHVASGEHSVGFYKKLW